MADAAPGAGRGAAGGGSPWSRRWRRGPAAVWRPTFATAAGWPPLAAATAALVAAVAASAPAPAAAAATGRRSRSSTSARARRRCSRRPAAPRCSSTRARLRWPAPCAPCRPAHRPARALPRPRRPRRRAGGRRGPHARQHGAAAAAAGAVGGARRHRRATDGGGHRGAPRATRRSGRGGAGLEPARAAHVGAAAARAATRARTTARWSSWPISAGSGRWCPATPRARCSKRSTCPRAPSSSCRITAAGAASTRRSWPSSPRLWRSSRWAPTPTVTRRRRCSTCWPPAACLRAHRPARRDHLVAVRGRAVAWRRARPRRGAAPAARQISRREKRQTAAARHAALTAMPVATGICQCAGRR